MPTIDDFTSHRWADAKEVLRKRDPSFVAKYEEMASEARTENPVLEIPKPALWLPGQGPVYFFAHRNPRRRLPRKWHRLLEACVALTEQFSIVQVAANGLTADMNKALSEIEAGRQYDYHRSSLISHISTLCERVERVLKVTIDLYFADKKERKSKEDHYCSLVKQICEGYKDLRNRVVHPRGSLGAEGITEEQLWEHNVAEGFIPKVLLNEFYWLKRGEDIKRGKYNWYADATALMVDRFSLIIGDLDEDITKHNAALSQAEEQGSR